METTKKYPYDIVEICMTFLYGKRFYATILSKVVKIAADKTETAGVGWNSNGKLTLFYNPEYLLRLPLEKAHAVLEHEVLHILFRHLTRFPFAGTTEYDRRINNMGCDCAINQYVTNLPSKEDVIEFLKRTHPDADPKEIEASVKGGGLYPETYGLPIEKNAEFYVEELRKQFPPQNTCPMCGAPQQQQGQGKQQQQGSGKGKNKKQQQGQGKQDQQGQGKDQQQGSGSGDKQQEATCPCCGSSQGNIDDHGMWDKVMNEKGEMEEASGKDIDREYEAQAVVIRAIRECKDYGKLPAFVQRELENFQKVVRHNWKYELKLFINSVLTVTKRLSQKRVNRRFAGLDFIIAGKKKSRRPTLLLARDTSGSVFNDEQQKEFINEMINIAKFSEISVCDCDTEIHQTYKVKKVSDFKAYKGGGGTDFRPVFDEARKLHVDGIIYLTDTEGKFPDKEVVGKFATKTIWVTVDQKSVTIPFGKHVNVESK